MKMGPIILGAVSVVVVAAAVGIGIQYGRTSLPSALPQRVPAEAPPSTPDPYRTALDGTAVSAGIYLGRVLDQSDVASREQVVRRLAFKFRSAGVRHNTFLGDDALRSRTDSAVPLTVLADSATGEQTLVVLTTRCVVDPMYPFTTHGVSGWSEDMSNFALVSDGRGSPEVFRLAPDAIPDRPELATTCSCDSGHPHLASPPTLWTRYSSSLGAGSRTVVSNQGLTTERVAVPASVPLLRTSLIEGEWNTNTGADLVLLYIPLGDAAAASLNPSDNLGIGDPTAAIRAVVAGRSSIWGPTFQFSLVSNQCMRSMGDTVAGLQRDNHLYKIVAIGAVAGALVVLVGATVGLPALVASIGTQALQAAGPAALRAAGTLLVSVVIRAASGERIQDVVWDESGNLIVSMLQPDGMLGRFAVAGLRRAGLTDAQAQRVAEMAGAFARRQGVQLAEMTSDRGHRVVSMMDPASQTDFSAEVLRRGLVRLAVDDVPLLAQHRRLIEAAQGALIDGSTRGGPAIQDASYQRAVLDLSGQAAR